MNSRLVVLIFPRLSQPAPGRPPGKPFLPLPVLTVGSMLEQHGYKVRIIDGRLDGPYRKAFDVLNDTPACVGISCMLGYQISDAIEAAAACRTKFPGVPIVWGGWFPTILPEPVIKSPYADFVVRGFGERAMVELLQCLEAGTVPDAVAGLTFLRDGRVTATPDRGTEDVNAYPSVNYDLVDTDRYSVADGIINYSSSRGCPHRCGFCCIRQVFKLTWIPLDADRVIADLTALVTRFRVRTISFVDDNFFVNKNRVARIAQGIIDSNLSVSWTADMRIDYIPKMDDEFLGLLKKSGCSRIFFGAESGSQRILDRVSKQIKKEQILEAARRLSEYKIIPLMSFVGGMPGETVEDFTETMHIMRQLRNISEQVVTLLWYYIPIPGSPLYIEEQKEGKLRKYTTLSEWAQYIPADVTTPWNFRNDDRLYNKSTRIRKRIRLMSFYNHLCNAARLNLGTGNLKPISRLINHAAGAIGNWRVASNNYHLPAEYWIYRLIQ